MTDDDFTEAARAEAKEPCEHHWVSHGQYSELIPWVIRCDLCGVFHIAEMERLARAHLATQEPTDADNLVAVSWTDCNCEWVTGYCDEYHRRTSRIPRSVLTRNARRDEETDR